LYYLLISLAQIVIFICTRFTLMGKENVPVKGAIVVVANHLSSADPVFLGTKLDRRIIFMAKEELFSNRFSSYFVRQFGAFRFTEEVLIGMLYTKLIGYWERVECWGCFRRANEVQER
jgi:1-acyl-sn-glycerol-3-phosphate acyltransferase